MPAIESDNFSIGDLLRDFYAVPDYQREYVWDDDQVEQLLGDRASLIKVAELLELPCFPIAVHKREVQLVDEKFGHTGHLFSRPLTQSVSTRRDFDRR